MAIRQVMMMRISERWTEMGFEPIQNLALYLYSIYEFLHLNDPNAQLFWALGTDHLTESDYLILLEHYPDEDGKGQAKPNPPISKFDKIDIQLEDYFGKPTKDDGTEKDPSKPDPLTTLADDEEGEDDNETA
jgi:hypothetical protein